jgi:hypothetical protein
VSGEATLDRPDGAEVLRELHGVLALAPDRALSALAERLDPHGASAFLVDRHTRTIVLQGGYWYRGEYVVEPDGSGSVVRYTIVNVAPPPRALGALTGRGELRAAPANFRSLLGSISDDAGGQGST